MEVAATSKVILKRQCFEAFRMNQVQNLGLNYLGVTRGERILFFGPNANTKNIQNQNFDRIRIIFVFSIKSIKLPFMVEF